MRKVEAAVLTIAPARAHDLGQTGRGRDIVLASRPRLEGVGVATSFLVSRHPFWCRDLAEVRTEGSWVVT